MGAACTRHSIRESSGMSRTRSWRTSSRSRSYGARAPQLRRSRQDTRGLPMGSETVLLVEDDESVRALSRSVLAMSGYTVLEANGAAAALRICEQHTGSIQIVVTDVVMPETGGRILVERLRAMRPAIRALYVSGYTDDTVLRHGVLEEGTAFLQKPFTPAALANKVREVLDQPSAPQSTTTR
ncbi:MAG: response regulator [Candidatus Eisenbacteria bacterium]|uniref:Response regulator n=1 Tax=Eiseniibacteriota bacterium TaxID=2212470 RepID=A0A538SS24_UNCEI|nr:MAG: response regulator [Candidatus Eisenbacteria bacterium]TMQ62772.1 MAG: response regulator [Candidatus Eisenbacteria bacterium]